MFSSRNKENIDTFWLKKAPYQELCENFMSKRIRKYKNQNSDFQLALDDEKHKTKTKVPYST